MLEPSFQIECVRTPTDLRIVANMFRAYAASIGVDLAYQDFETELSSLPGKYALPKGELLLARDAQGEPVGCVGLRPISPADCPEGCCEMKRLYVAPAGRGLGIGRGLFYAIIKEAVGRGYREIRLDTLPTMVEAIALYRKEGFVDTLPYYDTPVVGTIFLARSLVS